MLIHGPQYHILLNDYWEESNALNLQQLKTRNQSLEMDLHADDSVGIL